MYTFEITKNERFPEIMTGVIAPDDSDELDFELQAGEYIGQPDTPVIGLFLAENFGTVAENFITSIVAQPDLFTLQGIVTFGRRDSSSEALRGRSHFEIMAFELSIPLLCLKIPEQYPLYSQNDPDQRFLNEWVRNNPLKDLYHNSVVVSQDGINATLSPTT